MTFDCERYWDVCRELYIASCAQIDASRANDRMSNELSLYEERIKQLQDEYVAFGDPPPWCKEPNPCEFADDIETCLERRSRGPQ